MIGRILGRVLAVFALPVVSACSLNPAPAPRTAEESQLFGPVSMKLDTFSKVKDWTGSGTPSGVEALIEFDDRFGDRTKAAGTVVFELYDYRPYWPDPRGDRLASPWTGSLLTYEQQKAHWETASGAYLFRLVFDHAMWNHSYVLDATFQSGGGTRFFSQIVLPPQLPENRESSTSASVP
jgi:hypothetical protein